MCYNKLFSWKLINTYYITRVIIYTVYPPVAVHIYPYMVRMWWYRAKWAGRWMDITVMISVVVCAFEYESIFFSAHLPTGFCVFLCDWAEHRESSWNMQTQANVGGALRGRGLRAFCYRIDNQLLDDHRGLQESLQTRIQGMFILITYRLWDLSCRFLFQSAINLILCSLSREN